RAPEPRPSRQSLARRDSARSGGRARPRASLGWARSPRSSPETALNTPGERAAQKQAHGKRSATRFAVQDADACRWSGEESADPYSSMLLVRIALEASSAETNAS